MKKLALLVMAAAFMVGGTGLAQTSVLKSVKESKVVKQTETKVVVSAKERAEKMAKELKLTDAQTTQVTNLFTKQDASVVKLNTEAKVGSETYKMKLASIQKSGDTELQSIIGKEKFQKYQESLKLKVNTKMNVVKSNMNLK